MEEIKALLIELEQKFQKLEQKMDRKFQEVDEKFDRVAQIFNEKICLLDAKIDFTEERLSTKFEQAEKSILDRQFLFETEYGKKIDMIYDAVVLELDKNLEKSKKIRKLDARMDRNEIELFDHEKRISTLERS